MDLERWIYQRKRGRKKGLEWDRHPDRKKEGTKGSGGPFKLKIKGKRAKLCAVRGNQKDNRLFGKGVGKKIPHAVWIVSQESET